MSGLQNKDSQSITFLDLGTKHQPLLQLLCSLDSTQAHTSRILCLPLGIKQASALLNPAIEALVQKGVLVIAAAGNYGEGTVTSPGIHPGVLCVGAVDDRGEEADFSGRRVDGQGFPSKPDIYAPGVDVEIPMEDGTVQKVNGTSFACAHVAGVAAALLEARPGATAEQLKAALIKTSKNNHPLTRKGGTIQAEAALREIKENPDLKWDCYQSIPEWFHQRFIDPRLQQQCRFFGRRNEAIEALVIGKPTTSQLLQKMKGSCGDQLLEYAPFQHFDTVHIKARAAFYEALFKEKGLHVASATDISYFDM